MSDMNSNYNKPEESSSSSSSRGGGVADYFAILGVGEHLVWKHAQKKSYENTSVEHCQDDESEDEAALVERFYREIMQVTILAKNDEEEEERSRILGRAPSYDPQDIRSVRSSSSLDKQHATTPTLPHSPSHSDATTATATLHQQQQYHPSSAAVSRQQAQRDGFTVVQRTIPAGSASIPADGSLGGVVSANDSSMSADQEEKTRMVWTKSQTFDANLDPLAGLRAELSSKAPLAIIETIRSRGGDRDGTPLRGLTKKLGSSIRTKLNNMCDDYTKKPSRTKFHLAFRRRGPDETDQPAVADMSLRYVRIHRSTIISPGASSAATMEEDTSSIATYSTAQSASTTNTRTAALKRTLATGANLLAARVAEASNKHRLQNRSSPAGVVGRQQVLSAPTSFDTKQHGTNMIVSLEELLPVPIGFDEWSIPNDYKWLRFTHQTARAFSPVPPASSSSGATPDHVLTKHTKTVLISREKEGSEASSGVGIEAYMESTRCSPSPDAQRQTVDPWAGRLSSVDPDLLLPKLLPDRDVSEMLQGEEEFVYIPILAVRRQRTGDEERYHEDAAVVDIALTFCDSNGNAILPNPLDDSDEGEDGDDDGAFTLTGKIKWSTVSQLANSDSSRRNESSRPLGVPMILVRRYVPTGFADAAFATKVLDRFPVKNYKGLPLPEEELPMFCYPTGCRLYRARFSDAPLPQYYGFVVKNERGDSIHVSCVSFMEPLTSSKVEQLNRMSERRRRVSLAHRRFCEKRQKHVPRGPGSMVSDLRSYDGASETKKTHTEISPDLEHPPSETSWRDDEHDRTLLVGFGDMTTFENKTICLVSRFPFWTAFRRFLSHLHVLSGSSSDLPLERCISHLLLSVPIPKAGGPSVLVPLPALNSPMVLTMPPTKDFPLVDLPFQCLLACLDVPTIVTVVLGFLALERKLIVMSTRPSLVLDACELLRALLFPFELCAPYVPRLTHPFMSCLDFPGAIFFGIHDDGSRDGLASLVRNNLPEDSAIVDLDTGEIDCSGDRYEVLKQCWGVIPAGPRNVLVSEIETLCRDAGIIPGQEPLESQVDSCFSASIHEGLVDDFGSQLHEARESLDDRAVRDAFLRFFCSVLGGYERHLVVPDVDFLVSGNEWFDAQGYLAGAPQERAPFLGNLVATQLFQSFIQRRTEASDVHLLLFDECMAEYHSSPVPYGRLGGDVETLPTSDGGPPEMLYSLLVDQCSTEAYHPSWDEGDGKGLKSADSSVSIQGASVSSLTIQSAEVTLHGGGGDITTTPSRYDLADGMRFVYCIDGNPCFPQRLNSTLFYPREPVALLTETSEIPRPILARTEGEVEEAQRRRKVATTYRGLRSQRRCLWQLPKLMGSQFLGAWLLCIPAQVSQSNLSDDHQSRYLLRALGALRLLRNKQRIVADEAAYRALMAACGRTGNDRRVELVKLFGLLRSDGIFPSAVTLGQYTKALAEGYSKRSFGMPEDSHGGVEVTVSGSKHGRVDVGGKYDVDAEVLLNSFDGNLSVLEESGRRWRQRHTHHREATGHVKLFPSTGNVRSTDNINTGILQEDIPVPSNGHRSDRRSHNAWVPVVTSSSFVPATHNRASIESRDGSVVETRLIALWSRTRSCDNCSYIPLDEEIQSGWDVVGGQNDIPHTVSCPRCGSLLLPMLGYQDMSLTEALQVPESAQSSPDGLPRQITPSDDIAEITKTDKHLSGFVAYLDPAALRASLERYVNEEGETALDRDGLRQRDPELFYNFWWYCARFSLPLPLPISADSSVLHYCAFASWEKSIAFLGCRSGALALAPLYKMIGRETLWTIGSADDDPFRNDSLGDFPLLTRLNLQAICQSDWDQKDLSEILVTLVEACDKRDFKPVLECVLRCNKRRLAVAREARNDTPVELGLITSSSSIDCPSVELDCYRTLLYLAKYQCTSVFHNFFPATAKPCKGYHFWCAIGTPLPVFDHLFREAARRIRSKENMFTPVHDVSDVALGFRCIFGHII